MRKAYIAATRQNDGKTITCMGLVSAFMKKVENVGYIKPVGQRYIEIDHHKIDEDALLIKDVYNLKGSISDMSPVAIPRGFTADYIKNPHRQELADLITQAYNRVSHDKDLMVVEGTGHAGVGSVFDMSNGDVAKLLGTKVIMVSSGGVGKPIDEIMLNKALFDQVGVEILGIIVNKIEPDKYDKINELVRQGLSRKGLEVFGVMPYRPVLSNPTVEQLLEDIHGELISGHRGIRNPVSKLVIGAMQPHDALKYLTRDVLLITPGTREDMIIAAMNTCVLGSKTKCVAGIVLTGGTMPHPNVMDIIKRTAIPVIMVEDDTFSIASKLDNLIVKIRPGDYDKIRATEELIEEYIDIDRVLEKMLE